MSESLPNFDEFVSGTTLLKERRLFASFLYCEEIIFLWVSGRYFEEI